MPTFDAIKSSHRLAWTLPAVLIVYLVTTQGDGYLEFPYWFSFGSTAIAFLGPWLIVSAWMNRSTDRPASAATVVRVAAAAAAAVVMVVFAAAIPLHLVHHLYIHTSVIGGAFAGGAGLVAAGGFAGWRLRRMPRPVEVLLVLAVAAMVEADARMLAYGLLRDLGLYLRAGQNYLDGHAVYVMNTPADYVRDNTLWPYLYPPLTIPFFGVLAAIPAAVVKAVWLAMCVGVSAAGLRILGVGWRWVPVLLIWPPFVQGIYIGNAVVPTFFFFVAAPLVGALLAFGPIFKLQLGAPGLWLLRERRWRDVAVAAVVGLGLIVVTLPLVGLDSYREWLRQLSDFSNLTQQDNTIMGYSLQRWIGPVAMGAVGVAAVLLALSRRRGDGLSGLGVGSLALSPTIYSDGATMGLPALLRLRAPLLWFSLAMTSTIVFQQGYWVGLALGFAALFFPVLTHAEGPDKDYHPLGELKQAWPSLPAE